MFRGLTIVAVILIILIALSEILLLPFAEKSATALLQLRLQAQQAETSMTTTPAVLLLAGQVDKVTMTAQNATLGQVKVSSLELQGENVRLDMRQLIASDQLQIRSADRLSLRGVIKADDLAAAMQKKVDKLQEVTVQITPEAVTIQGSAQVAGRRIEVDIEGNILAESGGIYFHARRVNIRNAVFGKAALASLFDDVLLADLRATPFQLAAQSVVQQDGQVVVTLER